MAKKGTNPDYIAHGSDAHAAFLGLVKATKDDEIALGGWALADITMYGPTARPEFLMQILRQKVNELSVAPVAPQSEDPTAPHYAPSMWVPDGEPVRGIV